MLSLRFASERLIETEKRLIEKLIMQSTIAINEFLN